jgi:hypothetical protein
MLEPYEVKVSSTVLKGLEAGNGLRLLDYLFFMASLLLRVLSRFIKAIIP